jgi:hypothetical protein
MAERAEQGLESGLDAAPPQASVALAAVVLAERRSSRPPGEEWTARAPDGRLLDVWRVAGVEEGRRPHCTAALSPLVQVRHPNLVPVLAVGEREGGVWVVSELDAGRPLRRLLALATLTPEQAALVMLGVLEGLRVLHQAGLWHGRLDDSAVHVGATGTVRLGQWGRDLDAGDQEERRHGDREAAVRLLSRLGRSVRRPGSPRALGPKGVDQRQASPSAGLLRALEACGGEVAEEVALLAQAREAAAALLQGRAGERAARELAVLVGRLERDPVPVPAWTASPTAPLRAPHPLRSPQAVWAPASHRVRWVAIGLAVLLVVVAAALAVAARPARSRPVVVVPQPRHSASPKETPVRPAPTPLPTAAGPRPVPALAPPTAGPITAIEIQPLEGSCQPGAVCPVRVMVRLQPQPAAEDVRWTFRVFDRCTGTTSVLPGASVTALAGWPYVYGTSWPALSANHPLALVAVTETPAAAASPAVLAGGSGPC